MLVIKLRRIGKKHQPSYRLIVTEKRSRPQTAGLEDLGWFNPRGDQKKLNNDRVKYWFSKGAKATPTVHNLLISAGVIEGKKIAVHKKSKKTEGNAASTQVPAVAPEVKEVKKEA